MDKILITEEQWEELHKHVVTNSHSCTKDLGISLPEFTLCFKDHPVRVSYKTNGNVLTIRYISAQDNTWAEFSSLVSLSPYTWGQFQIPVEKPTFTKGSHPYYIKKFLEEAPIPFWLEAEKFYQYQNVFMGFEMIQKALLLLPEVWTKTTTEKVKVHKGKHSKKYTHSVKLQTVYTLNAKAQSVFKHYSTYTCECWGVRGHTRRLKNGKEIFVKPYRKGAKRNDASALVSKTYEF